MNTLVTPKGTPVPAIIEALAGLKVVLPLQPSDADAGTVLDNTGRDVLTVDVNNRRPDPEARAIALVVAGAINHLGTTEIAQLRDTARLVEEGLHPTTADMLPKFLAALAGKLLNAQIKHGYGASWATDDWEAACRADLAEHVRKGDPLDVAAYAAFCWARGWSTSAPDEGSTPLG